MDTPVLIMGYNRPHHLAKLIDRLREIQPTRLFVAIDGPRQGHAQDVVKVHACRELVGTIDWKSQVNALFREENLGCGAGVSAAITWFLEAVPEGIILEDDVIPDPTFFPYSATLLERYRHDDRVFAVSGCNVADPSSLADATAPYRFSRIPHVWGWATWRRSWEHHRLDLSDWRATLDARTLWDATGGSVSGTLYWGGAFHMVGRGLLDTWDVQLVHASMRLGALTATSNINLTENVGAGEGATHVHDPKTTYQPVGPAIVPIPDVPVFWDSGADAWARTHHFHAHVKAKQALALRSQEFREFVAEVRELASLPRV